MCWSTARRASTSRARACSTCSPASGALGLEALSRGARYCLFIEESAAARAAIRRNVEALGLTGVTKIWRRDATKLGEAGTLQPFHLIFCDPPYGKGLGERALAEAVNRGWAEQGAIAVLGGARRRRNRLAAAVSRRSTGGATATPRSPSQGLDIEGIFALNPSMVPAML